MTKKELKEEECFEYEFLLIDSFHEFINIIKIQAGCESDAWELLEEEKEYTSNDTPILLSERFKNKLKEVLK